MPTFDTAAVRERLTAERARLVSLRDAAAHLSDLSTEHLALERAQLDRSRSEDAAEVDDMERDREVVRWIGEELEEIVGALRRLDDGTWGMCITCGKPIDPDRLAVVPAAVRCVEDQTAEDLVHHRSRALRAQVR